MKVPMLTFISTICVSFWYNGEDNGIAEGLTTDIFFHSFTLLSLKGSKTLKMEDSGEPLLKMEFPKKKKEKRQPGHTEWNT